MKGARKIVRAKIALTLAEAVEFGASLRAWYKGFTRCELPYILTPKDVYGPNSRGETIRILEEKEEKE